MYSAFLGRILGNPAAGRASTSSGSAPDGGIAPSPGSGGATSSTQYKAVTRPYRCSQDSPALRSGSAIFHPKDGDGDGDVAPVKSTAAGDDFSLSGAKRPSLKSIRLPISIGSGQSSAYAASSSQSSSGALHLNELTLPTPPCPTAAMSSLGQMALGAKAMTLSTPSAATTSAVSSEHARRFQQALCADSVDMAHLRALSWQGCPVAFRYEAWMFLTGCWTAQAANRQPTASRRRLEYAAYIHSTYGIVDWDAVCAMVDSGVDTAVHRSTLKSLEQSVGAPRQASLTELVAAPLGAPRSLLRAASLTSSASTATLAREAIASPLPSLPHHSPGLHPASVSLEDVFSPLRQSANGEGAQPLSRLSQVHSAEVLTASSSMALLQAPVVSPLCTSASVGSIDAVGTSPPLHLQFSPSPSTSLPAQRFTTAVPAAASSAVGGNGGAAIGHQLSASTMLGSKELQTLKQIRKDIPRMSGGHCYLRHPRVQGSIERILFIWSLRHPACGYVQGMNDLVVPFMGVVLSHRFCPTRSITELHAYTEDIFDELWSISEVPAAQWINEVEADVYWMTSYLLNTMQDNYTSSHAGITTMMRHLAAVVQAADPPLYHRLVGALQLSFEQFSFRWMNCLLMRELTETQSLRLLDAYLSDEERRWSVTHVYVCAALLLRWGSQLMAFGEDYISAMKFLQAPPTEKLSLRDMQDVLSEGYVLQNLYEASLKRLSTTTE
ncbi:hypothetical protein LSCM1_03759 [Leishmania martiniquensis]|uniref:Rab-GAP TBC domain-containing protein n=1 Tax=Leishmania martiniquensis TaxID=1580590 RepID=A0A836H8K4_9TRYP|nr:hypothetical protein LSCM1_03759 [Leishmania martiniquensis]